MVTHVPAAPVKTQRDTLTVMIVDDSPSVRRVMSNLIKGASWTPLTAKDGLDAIEMLRSATALPDVVLTDIEMPRMDGYELLAALKANEVLARLPVAMITSRAGDKHRRKALDNGAADYLTKPYSDDELLAMVRRMCGNGGLGPDDPFSPRPRLGRALHRRQHTVAVDMRHVAGTGRSAAMRPTPRPGGRPRSRGQAFDRVLYLQTPAGRVSLGVEKVSQPFDTSERIPLSPLAGAEPARHFEAMAPSPTPVVSGARRAPVHRRRAHAADGTGRPTRGGQRRNAGHPRPHPAGTPRRPRPPGRVLGRDRRRTRRIRSPTRSARRRSSRSSSSPRSCRSRSPRRTCAALRLARPPAAGRRPPGAADDRSPPHHASGAADRLPPRQLARPVRRAGRRPTSRWSACPSPTRRPCVTSRSIAAARAPSSTSARPRSSCPTSRGLRRHPVAAL